MACWRLKSYGSRKMAKFVFLALCLALVACGRDDHFALVGFNEDDREQIRLAMVDWCDATEGQYCPTIASADMTPNRIRMGHLQKVTELGHGTIYGVGFMDHFPGLDLTLDVERTVGKVRPVGLHELGHWARLSRDHLKPEGWQLGECGPVMAQYWEEQAPPMWYQPVLTPADVRYALGE